MDFNERLEQMRQDMEQRRKEMEERLSHYRQTSLSLSYGEDKEESIETFASPHNKEKKEVTKTPAKQNDWAIRMPDLDNLKGLEDESETKIGNFRKLFPSYIEDLDNHDKKFASFGYSDEDLAPIINLLTAVVEIEFNAIFYKYLKQWGIELQYKNMRWATLGELLKIYDNEKGKEFLETILSHNNVNIQSSKEQFSRIKNLRNDANHAEVLTLHCFIEFYNKTFYPFYNETIKAILSHKLQEQKHSEGAFGYEQNPFENPIQVFSETDYQEQLSQLFAEDSHINRIRRCIIFTNTDQLALKYFGDVVVTNDKGQIVGDYSAGIIQKIIIPFIQSASKESIEYYLLDVADKTFGHLLDSEHSWQSHLSILDSFCRQNKINSDNPFGLFILGGDDVIPMPRLKNPYITAENNADKVKVLESTLEVDWLYSFPSVNVQVCDDGYLKYESLAGLAPRFHASRLPLETGLMETSIENDVMKYLDRDLQELSHGIDVRTFTLVACDSAKRVANKVVNGMPVTSPSHIMGEESVYEKAFVSPGISLELDEEGNVNDNVPKYIDRLKQTDLLAFLLHGGPDPNMPYFFGEEVVERGRKQMVAFNPDLFRSLPTKVVVPICCWGGRFINYRREKSALLSAIYSNVLLFLGSCRCALGFFDENFIKENLPVEITCAEVLQRLFLKYLLIGYPAGEALSLAKTTYLCNLKDPSSSDLLTVLEFNLFGDPMLYVKPMLHENEIVSDSSQEVSITLPNFKSGTFTVTTSVLYDSEDNDLLRRVRNFVDSNLNNIRNRLNKLLPEKYGVDPSTLRRIEKCTSVGKEDTYRFSYASKEMEHLVTYVTTDLDGNIKRIIGTI